MTPERKKQIDDGWETIKIMKDPTMKNQPPAILIHALITRLGKDPDWKQLPADQLHGGNPYYSYMLAKVTSELKVMTQ